MRKKGLIISYLREKLSGRLLDFGEDLQLWVERNLDRRFQVVCDPTGCGCNLSLFQPPVFNLYLRCWERSYGHYGLPDNLLIVASFGCPPEDIDRLFPSFHEFLMRHGRMHGFRYIAIDDTMLDVAIDERGHKTMAQTLLKPLGYLLMPNNYAIRKIES